MTQLRNCCVQLNLCTSSDDLTTFNSDRLAEIVLLAYERMYELVETGDNEDTRRFKKARKTKNMSVVSFYDAVRYHFKAVQHPKGNVFDWKT